MVTSEEIRKFYQFQEGAIAIAELTEIPRNHEDRIEYLKLFGPLHKREIANDNPKQTYCVIRNMMKSYSALVKDVIEYETAQHEEFENYANTQMLIEELQEGQENGLLDPEIIGEGSYTAFENAKNTYHVEAREETIDDLVEPEEETIENIVETKKEEEHITENNNYTPIQLFIPLSELYRQKGEAENYKHFDEDIMSPGCYDALDDAIAKIENKN